jgi:hypothetical protein
MNVRTQVACYLAISLLCAAGWYYILPPPSYSLDEISNWLNTNSLIFKEKPIKYYSHVPVAFTQAASKPTLVDKSNDPDIIILSGENNEIDVDSHKVTVHLKDIKVSHKLERLPNFREGDIEISIDDRKVAADSDTISSRESE